MRRQSLFSLGLAAFSFASGLSGCSDAAVGKEVPKVQGPKAQDSSTADSPSTSKAALVRGGKFKYDAATGRCLDAAGAEGLNPLPEASVLKTGRAPTVGLDLECVDFRGANFSVLFDPAYKNFTDWKLPGAKFDDNILGFSKFVRPDLRGARMGRTKIQYSEITQATVDRFTIAPSNCPAIRGPAATSPYSCRR